MAADRPEYRLSDAERQEALDALSEHVRNGRLDLVEFEERSRSVSGAKFRRDLEPPFADLPEPGPEVLRSAPAPARDTSGGRSVRPWRGRLASVAVPLAVVAVALSFFTVVRIPVLVFVLPVLVAVMVGVFGNRRR